MLLIERIDTINSHWVDNMVLYVALTTIAKSLTSPVKIQYWKNDETLSWHGRPISDEPGGLQGDLHKPELGIL